MATISIAPDFVFDQVDTKFDELRLNKPKEQRVFATPKPEPTPPLGKSISHSSTLLFQSFMEA